MEEDLTLGGQHTIQYINDVWQNYTLETYAILLTSITPTNSIKIKKNKTIPKLPICSVKHPHLYGVFPFSSNNVFSNSWDHFLYQSVQYGGANILLRFSNEVHCYGNKSPQYKEHTVRKHCFKDFFAVSSQVVMQHLVELLTFWWGCLL